MAEQLQLYSVPAAQVPMVSNLVALQMCKKLQVRRLLIRQFEEAGWDVSLNNSFYEARKPGETYAIPPRKCTGCGKWKRLDTFISVRGIEHPWCTECRFNNPVGAERVRADLAYRIAHHQPFDELLGIRRCKNPDCPNRGVIPPYKLRHGYVFCSQECRNIMAVPREDPFQLCANPRCPGPHMVKKPALFCSRACQIAATCLPCQNPACPGQRMIPPGRKYCSQACVVEHKMATGTYIAMSEKGVQRIADCIRATGAMPHAQQRSAATSKSNQEAPPRRRMVREDRVQGHLVRFIPDAASGNYRAQVDGVPGLSVTAPTKKQAQRLIAAALRNIAREQAIE